MYFECILHCSIPFITMSSPNFPQQKTPFKFIERNFLRGPDLNRRPAGYGPAELPDCSTPRYLIGSWGEDRTLDLSVMSATL